MPHATKPRAWCAMGDTVGQALLMQAIKRHKGRKCLLPTPHQAPCQVPLCVGGPLVTCNQLGTSMQIGVQSPPIGKGALCCSHRMCRGAVACLFCFVLFCFVLGLVCCMQDFLRGYQQSRSPPPLGTTATAPLGQRIAAAVWGFGE